MNILNMLSQIFTVNNLLMMNIGMASGIVIGALPGLNAVFAIAVLLPLTFGMESLSGMYLLLGAYNGAVYGGSISAILINTPGTSAACATVLDGYPLAKAGRAGDALKTALISSCFGGLFSAFVLMFFAPLIAKVALSFGAPEYFALGIFGICAVISLAGDRVLKGIVMMLLGLMISTVGIDSTEGVQRFVFGNRYLLAGIKPVTLMLGVFALSEVLVKAQELMAHKEGAAPAEVKYCKATIKIKEILKYKVTLIRSSIFGTIIGAIPGTGGAVAAILSYNEAKRTSKEGDSFGTGCIEGIVAPETANNAVTSAALIPLLTLGIPGDAAVAVLLGALTMQNIIPGPQLFSGDNIWVYCIMGGLFIINIIMLLQGSLFARLFANVIRVPGVILMPCIVILSVIGSFAIANVSFDVFIMTIFGIVGYFLRKNGFPFPPLIIAVVLGNFIESNLRRSLILSHGSVMIFFESPIAAVVLAISLGMLIIPAAKTAVKRRNLSTPVR